MPLEHLQESSSTTRRVPRWALVAGALILLVAAAELGLRLRASGEADGSGDAPEAISLADWQAPKANSTYRFEDLEHPINQLGLRGAAPDPKRHVTLISGGNVVFCAQESSEQNTLAGLIAEELARRPKPAKGQRDERLAARDNRFQVVNGGSPRITLKQSRSLILDQAAEQEIDALVIMLGYEDLLAAFAPVVKASQRQDEASAPWYGFSAILTTALGSDEAEQAKQGAQLRMGSKGPAITAVIKGIAKEVEALCESSTAQGIGVVLCVEPSMAVSQAKDLQPERYRLAGALGQELDAMQATYERLNAMLRAYAGLTPGVFHADTLAAMRGESEGDSTKSEVDDARLFEAWNESVGTGLSLAGRKRVARALASALKQYVPWDARPWAADAK